MKYDDRYIVELSRAAIFDDNPFAPEENVDWEYIYNKSIEQNIIGLLFIPISKLSEIYRPNEALFAKWQQKMVATIAITSCQYNEFLKMSKIFADNGIKIVILKGGFMRQLYPVPELRTMGDFDVLVKKSDLRNITNIFKNYGYTVNKAVFGIEAINKSSFWEIFYVLEEEFVNKPEEYTQEIYETSYAINDVFVPNPTFFLSHMIIHTGKHYIEKGAGIRNLLDIALFISKYEKEIDFGYLEKVCEEQNYKKIYSYIINSLYEWFGVDTSFLAIEKMNTELFIEYTLLNGIFGKHGNVLVAQFAKPTDDNIRGYRKLFFPTVKALKEKYKYLRKYPFLLPIAWIHRLLSGLFFWKYSLKDMIKDVNDAKKFSDERLLWMEKLDLKDKH